MTTIQTAPAIAFVDLASQHAEIDHEVAEGMRRVIDSCAFVNGPDVAAFESAWAGYCGRDHALGCRQRDGRARARPPGHRCGGG